MSNYTHPDLGVILESGEGDRYTHPDVGVILEESGAPPAGGYKPLLQKSNVGNDLYDGTIL